MWDDNSTNIVQTYRSSQKDNVFTSCLLLNVDLAKASDLGGKIGRPDGPQRLGPVLGMIALTTLGERWKRDGQ